VSLTALFLWRFFSARFISQSNGALCLKKALREGDRLYGMWLETVSSLFFWTVFG
jgi:hypothetical protein